MKLHIGPATEWRHLSRLTSRWDLFGVGWRATRARPTIRAGRGASSIESRCKASRWKWNTYDVVAVDGVGIKLAVNGKFVNGISRSTQKKGYTFAWSLGREASEIHSGTSKCMRSCLPA